MAMLLRSRSPRLVAGVSCIGRSEVETRSEEHTSELQSQSNLVCRLLLEKNNYYACCVSPAASLSGAAMARPALRQRHSSRTCDHAPSPRFLLMACQHGLLHAQERINQPS